MTHQFGARPTGGPIPTVRVATAPPRSVPSAPRPAAAVRAPAVLDTGARRGRRRRSLPRLLVGVGAVVAAALVVVTLLRPHGPLDPPRDSARPAGPAPAPSPTTPMTPMTPTAPARAPEAEVVRAESPAARQGRDTAAARQGRDTAAAAAIRIPAPPPRPE